MTYLIHFYTGIVDHQNTYISKYEGINAAQKSRKEWSIHDLNTPNEVCYPTPYLRFCVQGESNLPDRDLFEKQVRDTMSFVYECMFERRFIVNYFTTNPSCFGTLQTL